MFVSDYHGLCTRYINTLTLHIVLYNIEGEKFRITLSFKYINYPLLANLTSRISRRILLSCLYNFGFSVFASARNYIEWFLQCTSNFFMLTLIGIDTVLNKKRIRGPNLLQTITFRIIWVFCLPQQKLYTAFQFSWHLECKSNFSHTFWFVHGTQNSRKSMDIPVSVT